MRLMRWNVQDYLNTTKDVIYYLEACLEEKDDDYLRIGIKDSIKALRRITKKAKNGTQEKRASV